MSYSTRYHRFYNDRYYWSKNEYRPSVRRKQKDNDIFTLIQRRIKWMKRVELGRGYSYDKICPSGYTRNQGWIALCKAWKGFVARKREDDIEGMHYYAMGIRKIEKDLGISIYPFQDLKLAAVEYANDPDNQSLIEERAAELNKDPDELSSQEILDIMVEEDRKAYEILNS
ncbi:MAG: hypothetical protein WA941_08730 [Nitrososphaeraceae archaeon]